MTSPTGTTATTPVESAGTHYFESLGLEKDPFSTSPDPFYFYPLEQHRSCLNFLEISARQRRGASLILGEIGTGKTTLCRTFLNRLAPDAAVECHLLLNPGFDSEEAFLETLAAMFGLDPAGSAMDRRRELKHFLYRKGVEENRTVLLLIDEAQKLSLPAIECLRTLLNFETNAFKLLQLVLLGQLQLADTLRALPNFADRLDFKTRLKPLEFEECDRLLRYRLERGGYRKRASLFSRSATEAILRLSGGYPRRICMLAHKALEQLVILGRKRADAALIEWIDEKERVL